MKGIFKKLLLTVLALSTVLCVQVNALAADIDLNSSEANTRVNGEILSVSENSTSYRLNDEIAVIDTFYEVEYLLPSRSASWTYKDYTRSKYFYVIETGEHVANYSLTASFRYDGEELAECRGTQTHKESLNDSWKVEGIATVDNAGEHLGGAVGNFTLYKKNFWGSWEENNTDEIRIWCDHNGTISYN